MSIISVRSLEKHFYIPKIKSGILPAIASLFSRKYDRKTALNHISFEVAEGELLGYIGPNGAGKSTTVKILSGILTPDSGEVSVMGKTPWKNRMETVRQLGVVFGQRTQLWWDLPVIDSFELLKSIYSISDTDYKTSVDSLVEALQLTKLLHVPVRQLSLGQRMRCDLAASLLHSPKILFLDEPTIGLDAVSKLAVRDVIRKINRERKTTILLTTHDMDDIESLCNRVLVLHEGRIFLDGSLHKLRETISPERRLIIDLVNEHESVHDDHATLIKREGHRLTFSFDPTKTAAPELISRLIAHHAIRDLYVDNPPIEEIIANFYRNVHE